MKPKLIDYPESMLLQQPREIKQLLINVAEIEMEDKDHQNLMMEAADYISELENKVYGYLVKPCPFCGLQMEDVEPEKLDEYLYYLLQRRVLSATQRVPSLP